MSAEGRLDAAKRALVDRSPAERDGELVGLALIAHVELEVDTAAPVSEPGARQELASLALEAPEPLSGARRDRVRPSALPRSAGGRGARR